MTDEVVVEREANVSINVLSLSNKFEKLLYEVKGLQKQITDEISGAGDKQQEMGYYDYVNHLKDVLLDVKGSLISIDSAVNMALVDLRRMRDQGVRADKEER